MTFALMRPNHVLIETYDNEEVTDVEQAAQYFILWLNSHLCPPKLRRDDEEPGYAFNDGRVTLTFRGPKYIVLPV